MDVWDAAAGTVAGLWRGGRGTDDGTSGAHTVFPVNGAAPSATDAADAERGPRGRAQTER